MTRNEGMIAWTGGEYNRREIKIKIDECVFGNGVYSKKIRVGVE